MCSASGLAQNGESRSHETSAASRFQFWKKHTDHVIIFTILAPVLFTWHLGISRTRFDPYVGEGILGYVKVVPFVSLFTISYDPFHFDVQVRTTFFKLVVSLLAFLFILITNIKTFQMAKRFKNKMKALEHSLTLSTIVISACFVIYIIIQVPFLPSFFLQ